MAIEIKLRAKYVTGKRWKNPRVVRSDNNPTKNKTIGGRRNRARRRAPRYGNDRVSKGKTLATTG